MKKGLVAVMAVKAIIAVALAFTALSITVSSFTSIWQGGVEQRNTKTFIQEELGTAVTDMCSESGTQGPYPPSGNYTEEFPNADELEVVQSGSGGPIEHIFSFRTMVDGSPGVTAIVGFKGPMDGSCDDVSLQSMSGGAAGSGLKEFRVVEDSENEVKIKVWDAS